MVAHTKSKVPLGRWGWTIRDNRGFPQVMECFTSMEGDSFEFRAFPAETYSGSLETAVAMFGSATGSWVFFTLREEVLLKRFRGLDSVKGIKVQG